MENYKLEKDIHVFCVTAKSFPDGILEAHQKLHSLIAFSPERNYFGISRPENGVIVYKAAAEELEKGELEKHGLEPFVIKSGNYISVIVENYKKDISIIAKTFQTLIKQPNIDPQGYCVEWYVNDDDVQCMVRLR